MDQRDVVVVAEEVDDLLCLPVAEQPVVDEDTGELVADRLVDQHRRDRGIDAAGEATDHPALADFLPDPLDRLVAEGRHRPVAGAAGDAWAKLARILPPSGVWTTSGWNWIA